MTNVYAVDKLIAEARRLAAEYRKATGQPLSISSEIAEFDAARLLDLELRKGEQGGYDAVGRGAREGKRIQIKGRAVFDERKPAHRLGQFKLDKEWDSLVLVLMDDNYEPIEIYEAERADIEQTINEAGASRRSKRGLISIRRFKHVGRLVWTRQEGLIADEIWDNQSSR